MFIGVVVAATFVTFPRSYSIFSTNTNICRLLGGKPARLRRHSQNILCPRCSVVHPGEFCSITPRSFFPNRVFMSGRDLLYPIPKRSVVYQASCKSKPFLYRTPTYRQSCRSLSCWCATLSTKLSSRIQVHLYLCLHPAPVLITAYSLCIYYLLLRRPRGARNVGLVRRYTPSAHRSPLISFFNHAGV
jgi:hypothetical protein